jgi:bacillithiol biosynthesis cysteine-adding enzyme BshC
LKILGAVQHSGGLGCFGDTFVIYPGGQQGFPCHIMIKTILPYSQVPQLAKTDVAYATHDQRLLPFMQYPPTLDAFTQALADRKDRDYPRADLVTVLTEQYRNLPVQTAVQDNISALAAADTFTITTAHQPALFLGPLYFLYKAMTAIVMAEDVQKQSGKRIVPVFVLGSEDHDLDELNHIQLFNKRLDWQPGESGAVGSMGTGSIAPILEELKTILGDSGPAAKLFDRVSRAYTGAPDFASATQALLHELFGRFGLVVLNMNHPLLKRHFIPVLEAEITEQASYRIVQNTIDELFGLGFKPQASPREINVFYMKAGLRERIVLEGDVYKVINSDLSFTKSELLAELHAHPEHFSPNVILRPLYQEMILPNLAYVGGGGELAYWLERKAQFEHFGVLYPMLVRRHSVLWLDRDASKKIRKFGFTPGQFFEDTEALVKEFVRTHADESFSLESELAVAKSLFEGLEKKAILIDPTLGSAVKADAVKFAGSLEQWQSRLARAEKQKHEVTLNQLRALKEKLYPGGGLQERTDNFMGYFLKYGDGFLDSLKEAFGAFDDGFLILSEE